MDPRDRTQERQAWQHFVPAHRTFVLSTIQSGSHISCHISSLLLIRMNALSLDFPNPGVLSMQAFPFYSTGNRTRGQGHAKQTLFLTTIPQFPGWLFCRGWGIVSPGAFSLGREHALLCCVVHCRGHLEAMSSNHRLAGVWAGVTCNIYQAPGWKQANVKLVCVIP